MSDQPPPSACARCGQSVPPGAGFCPACGTAVASATGGFDPPTGLPAGPPATGLGATVLPIDAATVLPSDAATALPTPGAARATPGGTRAFDGGGPFQAGQQIGPRYTVIRMLGAGGMGAVYQAFDHELGVAVAIKVIRPAAQSDATAAKELEQRFKRELVLARQVTHKYVVRIHDLGEIDGIKYLTMPFVDGETLADVLRKGGPLPPARALAWAKQIAEGLQAAHDKGVIHRDLKPENVMIESSPAAQGARTPSNEFGDALIMDFGIARSVDHGATQTAAGAVIGTIEYMAPEQAQGAKVDQRTDQYAFGLILYDMLTGRQRLAARDNPMSELLGRLQQAPPTPRSLKPDVPEAIDALVMRCLQPSPDARFGSTSELVAALSALTPDGHVRPAGAATTGVVPVAPAASRPKWQLAVAGLAVAALAGGGGWLLSRGRGPAAAPTAHEPVSVLIADFSNRTGDDVINGVVEQALGLGIEGASFVATYPRRDALRAAAAAKLGDRLDEKTAQLVAVREGVDLVLAGDIEAKGAGFRITTRAVSGDQEGRTLYTIEADASGKPALLEAVGALAGKVRTALGDTAVPSDGPAANETFTAANLEAARAYAQGQEMQAAGKREEAINAYKDAIRLDPEMGRAYSGAAAQLANLGRRDEAEQYYQQALARIDRMTEREKFRTRGSYYLFARKPQEAIKEYTALKTAYPADNVWPSNLALANFYARNMAQALEQGREAAARSKSVAPRSNLALYAMYAGQFETAITETDEVRKINPNFEKAFVARALSELGLGRPADATKTWESLKGLSATGASFASLGLADLALYQGRTKDALAALAPGIAADMAAHDQTGLAQKRLAQADAFFAQGNLTAAASAAEEALAASNSVALPAGLMLARAGRVPAALKLADQLAASLEPDPQAYAHLIRAEAALARNQARAALDEARAAQQLADSWMGRVVLARVYLALDQFTEATSELDAAIKRQGEATAVDLDDFATFRYFPQVYYYQGVARAGLGSPAARESFAAFLAIKQNGDETGGLVADAKKRAAP